MKKYILIITLVITIGFTRATAQDKKWTLEDCINYAITNNISLQRQRILTETTKADLLQSRLNLLPSLNAGSDGSMDFGRSVDYRTNLITYNQNLRNSYYLSSSITFFNGFSKMSTVSANSFMLKAGLETEKVQRNTLIIDIIGQYYLVIYTKGLEEVSKMQLESSEGQLKRIIKMVETGKEALSKQYEMESRVSADKLDYTIARNTASQSITSLRQMLQLNPSEYFDVVIPDVKNFLMIDETFKPDSIYNIASITLPRLKAIEYQLNANKKLVAAAKASAFPSLSLNAAMYTGYAKVIGVDSIRTSPFSTQLKNNNAQQLSVSLNIPLFNNYRTGRNIKLAKLRRDDTALKLELEKNILYTEIENVCFNYNRGKDEFLAAESNLEYNKKSFDAVQRKFESGIVDVTDFSIAKTTLFQAETEALRTKLQLMIRRILLQFYTTGEYEGKFGM